MSISARPPSVIVGRPWRSMDAMRSDAALIPGSTALSQPKLRALMKTISFSMFHAKMDAWLR